MLLTIDVGNSTTACAVFMGKAMVMGATIIIFSGSTILGSIFGIFALKLLDRAGFVKLRKNGA